MVAHFEVPAVEVRRIPSARLPIAINSLLPHDIRVQSAARKPAKFHARFDATGKQYRYFVWTSVGMNPLLRHTAWHVPRKLDLTAMRAAAKLFVGERDFQSFAANPGYKRTTTVRNLTRCEMKKSGAQLTFIIEGDGFLYRMCRGIVGTLVQVGMGKFSPDEVDVMLAKADRRVAGMSAPAHGLVLWKVYYSTRGRKAAKARNQVEAEE
jgi:tRNA pseudouridine38-40 synthase